jgi:hypothetical protein
LKVALFKRKSVEESKKEKFADVAVVEGDLRPPMPPKTSKEKEYRVTEPEKPKLTVEQEYLVSLVEGIGKQYGGYTNAQDVAMRSEAEYRAEVLVLQLAIYDKLCELISLAREE